MGWEVRRLHERRAGTLPVLYLNKPVLCRSKEEKCRHLLPPVSQDGRRVGPFTTFYLNEPYLI
jgi:hypothetical protein